MIKKINFKEFLALINDDKIIYVSKRMFGKLPDGTFGLLRDELRDTYSELDVSYIKKYESDTLLEYDEEQSRVREISKFLNIDLYSADAETMQKLFNLKLFQKKQEVMMDSKKVYIDSTSFIDNGFVYTIADCDGEIIKFSVPEHELKATA